MDALWQVCYEVGMAPVVVGQGWTEFVHQASVSEVEALQLPGRGCVMLGQELGVPSRCFKASQDNNTKGKKNDHFSIYF